MKNREVLFFVTIILLILFFILSIIFGSVTIPLNDVFNVILGNNNAKKAYEIIIFKLRLPRTVLALLAGGGLAIVGSIYQGILKNPMAEPYTLGVSAGAALGAVLGIVFFKSMGIINMISFLGAILTIVIVYKIAKVGSFLPPIAILLAGVAVSFFLSSVISLIMIFNRSKIADIIYWTMGSFATVYWEQIIFLGIILLLFLLLAIYFTRDLNILQLGEEEAKTIGVNVEFVKKIFLFSSAIVVSAIVSITGIIGFIGLIVPHIVRILIGQNYKNSLIFSFLFGGIFAIGCDIIARVLAMPSEIPVGVITSILGVPYFLYLLYKNKKKVF
ncbi:FecCD family ABC transporter permease [Haliovirga abyssi]|uniref:Corrinoid ABC transporter permease n=1 Tax=Haliovirga abyssi TaxID=2996794 RepID=A0AAU9DHV2_9FUSO|nr:iron ABC transporter permease [Haliovirga abyssi]BDU51142.1 corrinoid ABC transporter permease [Haliovirga abyssi]